MSIKSIELAKSDESMIAIINESSGEVKESFAAFYNNGVLPKIMPNKVVEEYYDLLEIKNSPLKFPQPADDLIHKQCIRIRENIKAGKANNLEINLAKKFQVLSGTIQKLGDVLLKMRTMNGRPYYLSFKAEEVADIAIFIGDDNHAYLYTHNEPHFIRLSEVIMFSIFVDPDTTEEVGILTNYSWISGKVYSEPIVAESLDPVKYLMFSEALEK